LTTDGVRIEPNQDVVLAVYASLIQDRSAHNVTQPSRQFGGRFDAADLGVFPGPVLGLARLQRFELGAVLVDYKAIGGKFLRLTVKLELKTVGQKRLGIRFISSSPAFGSSAFASIS
jgi:hypothetical protein